MNKSGYPILVSLIALVLLSPAIGLGYSVVEDKSELISSNNLDSGRGDPYGVMLEYAPGDTGEDTLTRNEEISIDFVITNTGDNNDVYDLSVTWTDSNDYGWYAEPLIDSISLDSDEQETVTFNFTSPVQGVGCQDNGDGTETCDDMDFMVEVVSQGDSSINANLGQNLEIDTVYAVDLFLRTSSSKSGARTTTVEYAAQIKNVGKNTDEFLIYLGDLPKDWSGSSSLSSITLTPGQSEDLVLSVEIPNTAAEDESASIDFIAQVQFDNYDYIYGFCSTNTSVTDGRVYGVELTTSDISKKVIPDGEVTYTLSVKNTGSESDSFQLEIEDVMQFGWSTNLSQFNVYNLGPNEIFNLDMIVTSPEDSEEDDWSLSNITIYSTNREQFGNWLETNTSVRIPVRDLSLTISESSKSGNPDQTVTYTLTLTNDGSDPDDFSLGTVKCSGCNAWVVSLSVNFIEDLGVGNSQEFEMYVKVPASALDTDSAEITATAVSTGDSTAEASVSSTTTVNTVYDGEVTTDDHTKILNPSQLDLFNITIRNKGNAPESYTLRIGSNTPDNWEFGDTLPYSTGDLAPYGGSDLLPLSFEIPEDQNSGYYNFSLNLYSDSSGLKIAELSLSVKVEYFANFSIEILNDHLTGNPGKVHSFSVVIDNRANHEEDVSLIVDDVPSDWSYCISNNCLSSIKVSKGESKTFQLKITTSSSDLANLEGVLMTLIGTSGLNDKITISKIFKVSTNEVYNLEVTTEIDTKTGNIGSTLPFHLTLVNKGNALDYIRLPFATVPSGWIATYRDNMSSFNLGPGSSVEVFLDVQVPAGAYGGNNFISSKIESEQSGQVLYLNFTVYIKEDSKVDVELKQEAGDVTAGTTGSFKVLLSNSGNTVETVSLSFEGNKASWFTLTMSSVKLEPGNYEEIIIEVKPPIMQATGETSGILNVTLSSDTSKSTKIALPFMVLKSDLVNTEPVVEEEDNLLPSLSLVPSLLLVSIISLLRRRD